MKWTCSLLLLVLCCTASPAGAQILRLTDLNAAQLRALDRSKTVVLLTGGMLEEHGPYLPACTDGILSERLTQEIAQSIPRYVDLLTRIRFIRRNGSSRRPRTTRRSARKSASGCAGSDRSFALNLVIG